VSAVTADTVVSLVGVHVRYGETEVLAVEALEAYRGEVLALIGPNGSGKSTLLRVIGLLQTPTTGEVRFRGRRVTATDALAERRRMAMVFQQPWLADMTVNENVSLGLRFRGTPRAEIRPRAERWLERLAIAPLRQRRARSLSGGEAQRVALARALVLDPELLLLDEPFAALDPPSRADLIGDLASILRGDRITTILVTHDRGEAQTLADRVGVILGGRLQQLDATARVFQAPASEEVARFVGVETIVAGVVTVRKGGVTLVDVGGCTLEAGAPAAPGERVRLCLRPEDVTLASSPGGRGAPSSARNQLPGTVIEVGRSGGQARIVVDCGFPLVAALTPRSVEELGLAVGTPVTAVFKASALHLIPYGI
jgi:tungstate transport system ATP-binding protein